jgi:hypothetical protein
MWWMLALVLALMYGFAVVVSRVDSKLVSNSLEPSPPIYKVLEFNALFRRNGICYLCMTLAQLYLHIVQLDDEGEEGCEAIRDMMCNLYCSVYYTSRPKAWS